MDRANVKTALRAMWPILFRASQRSLTSTDREELQRLLRIVESSVVNVSRFKDECDAFCLAVRTCGIFEESADRAHGLDLIREKNDRLCAMLG